MKRTLSSMLAILFTLALFAGSVSADEDNDASPVGNTIDGWHSLYSTGDIDTIAVNPILYKVRDQELWVEVYVTDKVAESVVYNGYVEVHNKSDLTAAASGPYDEPIGTDTFTVTVVDDEVSILLSLDLDEQGGDDLEAAHVITVQLSVEDTFPLQGIEY